MSNCRYCGKNTDKKPSNRRSFCNLDCFTMFNRQYHPKRKRKEVRCKNCDKKFEITLSDPKKFCSHNCSATFNNTGKKSSKEKIEKLKQKYADGKLSGLYNSKNKKPSRKTEIECPICKTKILVFPYQIKNGRKFCSHKCSQKRPGQGGYHPGSVRNYKSGWYTSPIAGKVWLDSSYELVVAHYLDSKKYKWIKNHKGFPYIKTDGSGANYVPDFYIEDLDLWIETKGYMVENDKNKILAFPHKIILITKKEIFDDSLWGF